MSGNKQKIAIRATKRLQALNNEMGIPDSPTITPKMVRLVLDEYFRIGPRCILCGKAIRGNAIYDPYYSTGGFMHGPGSKCFRWGIQRVMAALHEESKTAPEL